MRAGLFMPGAVVAVALVLVGCAADVRQLLHRRLERTSS